jgi:cytochrome b subunit of formate dehydrogenase/nitrate/TMAO reductase-like tetraheme cytochrome c subunit
MVPVQNASSPVFKLNLPKTCAKCHSNPDLAQEYRITLPQAAEQYLDSIHGRGLLKMGLIVAPSCNDCHGVHDIVPGTYTNSPVHHSNISRTCGECHLKIEETYNTSVHGQLLVQGDAQGPTCTDCHSAHEIEHPTHSGRSKTLSDERCGRCHQDSLVHYRDTYHGKAMALGRPHVASDVAACFDCHGHHDVLPSSNPDSRLSKQNILNTCQACHPNAGPGFVKYQPHANPLDRERYTALNTVFILMTLLLIGVFGVFGAHTLLWLFRSAWVFLHDSKKFREARIETQADDEWFTRFIPFERFLHFLVVTSFLLLVITGMPLKFYYTSWAHLLFNLMGGPEVARSLHHFGALITFLYFALHLIALLLHAWRHRGHLRDPESGRVTWQRLRTVAFGPDSMIPTLRDWHDFVAHQKWFFGRGSKPQFDRWTYWEKFDYFAVFWGVFIIGLSGLIMWFPEFFTSFLPGWIINIALIVHSDEALLAAGFIFTIHFFNTHFRLEKFPMDTVIFSGRISKAEMIHERRRWYDRLVAEGRLEEHRVKDEWERWKAIARSMGYIFFGVGVILLILIIYAMTSRLIH